MLPGGQSGRQGASWRIWLAVCVSVAIAVAAVLRRLAALANPSTTGPPQMVSLDRAFQSHALLTLVHVVPALVFVLLIPFTLLGRPRQVWQARLLFATGGLVGLSAYAMSAFAVGGWVERFAVLFFDSLYLLSLVKAYRYTRSSESDQSTRWLTRAIWILLGIATTRPVMGVFFATRSFTHLEPEQFFGYAFWIGFSINTIGVEVWLRSERSRQRTKFLEIPSTSSAAESNPG